MNASVLTFSSLTEKTGHRREGFFGRMETCFGGQCHCGEEAINGGSTVFNFVPSQSFYMMLSGKLFSR